MSNFEAFSEATPSFERNFSEFPDPGGYIDSIRIPQSGPLDIIGTAAQLLIPVRYDSEMPGHAEITGLYDTGEPIEILIADDDNEKAMSFAHEIGHYFLYLEGCGRKHVSEERFCEYFGRRLCMPDVSMLNANLVTGELLVGLCEDYQVATNSLLIWLMEQNVLPPQLIVDTRNHITPNPEYSQVVTRHIACIGCSYGTCEGAKFEDPESELPVLDLTSHELARSMEVTHSLFMRPGDPEFEALQARYSC